MNNDYFQILRLNKSPFYKERHHDKYVKGKRGVKVDFKISETAYNDLMKYFKGMGLNKTEGFKQIIWDKLEMINTSRRTCFNNVEVIMLIPRSRSVDELNEESRIIGLYNTESDFIDEFNHLDGFDKSFNYRYDLHGFYEDFFPMDIVNSTKESPIYRVNKRDLQNWDSLYARLDELYGLGNGDWDFVRFPLNNYLDVNREGQFQSPSYRGKHEGIYIFDDLNNKRLYCLLNWSYSLENKNVLFDFSFVHMSEFMYILHDADYKKLRDSYKDLKNSDYDKEQFDMLIKNVEGHLDFLKRQREKM